MIILAIDTSCDETAVAITQNTEIVSNVVWSQATLHSSFGGVMPSLAQRQHEERIDWVVEKAIKQAGVPIEKVDAIAVTIGNGLGIALGVGINKAKELAIKYKKPLIPVSHTEAHLLSSFCEPLSKNSEDKRSNITFPALGLVLSGGTTVLALIKNIGEYEILAETSDDALGEALDKGARLLGLGYPGGAILEKLAKTGDAKKYKLPLPLQNDVIKNRFSYSGLKTAFVRLFDSIKDPNKQDVADLAASFQSTAFKHIEKILEYQINALGPQTTTHNLLFGGGVANNIEIKKRLRKLLKKYDIKLHVPYTKKLNGDNAGMIGVCAHLKNKNTELKQYFNYESVDRNPRLKLSTS
ncbi:MAG: tRNA (adenosine(37)-N6)-threonylcarbamoyltransferase complex transferase subunit TsaD [Microgenomates group bacterium]